MTNIFLGIIAVELGVVVAYICFTMAYSAYSVFVLDKRVKEQEEKRAKAYMEMMSKQAAAAPEVSTTKNRGHYA